MSEAKVLNSKQQRHTLSNIKKKRKAPPKNVYVHPSKDYWPVLSAEDESTVLSLLRKLYHAYQDVKNLNESSSLSSKSLTSDLLKVHQTKLRNEILGNQLVVGLRKVIVEIESGSLKVLLLDNNVDPPSLGYVIGNVATANNIPFIAISNLKSCVKDLLGFQSWCVGVKVSSEHFDPICDKIKSFLLNMQPKTPSQQGTFLSSENIKKRCLGVSSEVRTQKVTELYFYRSDKSKRMFVPVSSSSSKDCEGLYLSFSKDPSDNVIYQREILSKPQNKPGLVNKLSSVSQQSKHYPRYFTKVELLPLQVKRFRENPNKEDWKKSKTRSSDTIRELCKGT